jgi:hypothetical protein
MTVPIEQQAASVEISAANLRGHIENLQNLIARNKRPATELDIFVDRLPSLEAAAKTLRWMSKNESSIRKAVAP